MSAFINPSPTQPEDKIKVLNLRVANLEEKLSETVDLLHIWKNHALAYQRIMEVHGISTESLDREVMAQFLSDMQG
ncbi:hypothetical protein MLD52_07950 [Puniceicoccaceae bacterium K14]|nr:hypothetical protein [Puniceicoccaceae bacterium K14]